MVLKANPNIQYQTHTLAIKPISKENLAAIKRSSSLPKWNPRAERKALVFRPSKAYTTVVLGEGTKEAFGTAADVPLHLLSDRLELMKTKTWSWFDGPIAKKYWDDEQRDWGEGRKTKKNERKDFLTDNYWQPMINEARILLAKLPFLTYSERLSPAEKGR